MRKTLAVISVFAAAVLCLTGCGPKISDAEKNAPPPAGPRDPQQMKVPSNNMPANPSASQKK